MGLGRREGLKLAVVGPYSSGKTTLAKGLRDTLPNAYILEESARRVISASSNSLMKTPDVRSFLIVNQLLIEAETKLSSAVRIADGGVINNLAHDRVLLEHSPDRASLMNSFNFMPYDVIFWCNYREIEIEDDGQRFTDPLLRDHLEVALGAVMLQLGAHPVRLSGSPDQRLKEALSVIDRLQDERGPGSYQPA